MVELTLRRVSFCGFGFWHLDASIVFCQRALRPLGEETEARRQSRPGSLAASK